MFRKYFIAILYINIVLMKFAISSNMLKTSGSTINILKNSIIMDKKMPSLYLHNNFVIDEELRSSIYSMEHIFPRSLIKKEHINDIHNIARTINNLNIKRSNYKYIDEKIDEYDWETLEFGNSVNHKKRLFIPNECSRGFISRAILYMCKEYKYNFDKIIDKETLLKWYYNNPPTIEEKYHNKKAKELQNKNNNFISNYNRKKNIALIKFFETL